MTIELTIAVLVSFVTAYVVTPLAITQLKRAKLIDRPDGRRKLHVGDVAVGGGVAVLLAVMASFLAITATEYFRNSADSSVVVSRFSLLLVAAFLCTVGLIDDRMSLRGRQKLLFQIAAAAIATYSCGLAASKVSVFGQTIDIGVVGYIFSVCWLLASINAVNLIDGSDGTASIVGICIGVGLVAMCFCNGRGPDAILPAILAAALLGFLPYNFPPARVFLGDAGSQLIGLLLGVAAIQSSLKGPTTVAMAGIVAVWTVPLLDTSAAILRRKLTGKSVYSTDRGHIHHRLQARGLGSVGLLASIAILSVLTVAGGVASVAFKREWVAWSTVLVVVAALLLTRVFGHAEARLVAQKGGAFAQSLLPRKKLTGSRESRSRVYGTLAWESIWQALLEYCEKFDVVSVRLELHLPKLDEDYVATWSRDEEVPDHSKWHTRVPLNFSGMPAGSISVSGAAGSESAFIAISSFADGLGFLEADILATIAAEEEIVRGADAKRQEAEISAAFATTV